LVSAAHTGRNYLGIELEAKYVEQASRRLAGVARARVHHSFIASGLPLSSRQSSFRADMSSEGGIKFG